MMDYCTVKLKVLLRSEIGGRRVSSHAANIVTHRVYDQEYKATISRHYSERSDADLTTYCSTQAVVRSTAIIPSPSPTPAANN